MGSGLGIGVVSFFLEEGFLQGDFLFYRLREDSEELFAPDFSGDFFGGGWFAVFGLGLEGKANFLHDGGLEGFWSGNKHGVVWWWFGFSDSWKPDPLTDWGSFGRLDGANSTRGPVAKAATGVEFF